ncbi:MAG TPA: hypothetical protein VIM84_07195 [Gemmatimonadales bacterium]
MRSFHPALGGLALAGLVGYAAACNNEPVDPTTNPPGVTVTSGEELSSLTATLRVRCERRPNRSKISVDANDVTPRNGSFRARVRAAGGTVTSAAKRAVGDEVEFDFDSDRDDIAAGATRIPANFIQRRDGADVVGILLNAQGDVVARRGVECEFRG